MLDPRSDPGAAHSGDVARLILTRAQFDGLADRIEQSLALTDGRPRIVAARPGDDARFFASRETFSILHLCNHWTAGVLNAAGVPVRPVRSIASAEVVRSVRAAAVLDRKLDMSAPRA